MKTQLTIYRDHLSVAYTQHTGKRPPVPEGARSTTRMSSKTAKKVRRAASAISAQGECYFYTLTYPMEVDHAKSKNHLNLTLKRLKRRYDFVYLWVAEIQPKRFERTGEKVIHYHILANIRLDIRVIREAWNATRHVFGDYPVTHADWRVHAMKIDKPAAYMAKVCDYLTKDSEDNEWQRIYGNRAGIDRALSDYLKPVSCSIIEGASNWGEIHESQRHAGLKWFSTENYLVCTWGFARFGEMFRGKNPRQLTNFNKLI